MEHHKLLYKDCQFRTSRQYNSKNRQLLEANRNEQRRDRFQQCRNISPSPVRHQKVVIIPLCEKDKENANINQEQNLRPTRFVKFICNAKTPEILTKQEEYMKRFIEWKENKKTKKKEVTKKPFISAVNSCRQTTTSSSLVPRGHHKEFHPPVGLKNPVDNKKVDQDDKIATKGRESIYTVVPTPPRKRTVVKSPVKFPVARKALPPNVHKNISNLNKAPKSTSNQTKNETKPITVNELKNEPLRDNKKTIIRKSPKSAAKLATVNLKGRKDNVEATTTPNSDQPTLRKNLVPRALKMPPPPTVAKPTASATNKQTGAIPKTRIMTTKPRETVKRTKKSPLRSGGAGLAQSFKAKKPNAKKIQVNGKKLLTLLNNNQPFEDMVIQTPRDFATLNPFAEFVTSTKIKDSSKVIKNVEGVTHTEVSHTNLHSNSSAKRNLMQGAKNITLKQKATKTTPERKTEENTEEIIKENCFVNVIKKHNFIRYSEVINDHSDIDEMQVKEKNILLDKENKTGIHTAINEITPPKSSSEARPANYLSPFVSVARGKVSLKKEAEKRNSIYLQKNAESSDLPAERTSQNISPNYSIEVRRTLEAVRYFRKQLQDEIDRLHHLCNIWEVYKNENLEKIQNANGEDMINVTIGQTRLLTSKKFMQFKGLIDRCEAGATGIGAVQYDGSEDTKPITSVDLEGFWSMLGLQIDNLDKRFDNLNRWKLNDWKDPDELQNKIKKNLTKVKKVKPAQGIKAKPNSALQQMMRKMQAEMRKKKNNNDNNGDIVITPSKSNQGNSLNGNNTTPHGSVDTRASRRYSIVVKDRKYFSPAATVISVSSSNRKSNSIQRQSTQDSPKIIKYIESFNEAVNDMGSSLDLRKSVLLIENSRRMSINPQSSIIDRSRLNIPLTHSVAANSATNPIVVGENVMVTPSHACLSSQSHHSPVASVRKSILKTPGTAKSKLRNVIFNEKLRVKKFNFLINEDGNPFNDENGQDNQSHEEDLYKSCEEDPKTSTERTLTLRNRKVRLRPSCEIVIPQ